MKNYRRLYLDIIQDIDEDKTFDSISSSSNKTSIISATNTLNSLTTQRNQNSNILPPLQNSPSSSSNSVTTNVISEVIHTRKYDNTWDTPNNNNGIQTYYGTTIASKPFQAKLIGKEPSIDYISKNMPKKIRLWLGI